MKVGKTRGRAKYVTKRLAPKTSPLFKLGFGLYHVLELVVFMVRTPKGKRVGQCAYCRRDARYAVMLRLAGERTYTAVCDNSNHVARAVKGEMPGAS